MSNSSRGAPRVIHEGIRDASGRAAIREVPIESTLVPLVFLIAEKQRDEPVFMSPSQIPALLGAKTLEKTSPYYSHATKLLETIAANASGFVCYPVQVPGSQKALLRLGIVEYDSSPDGNVEQSCWNEGGLIHCRTIGHYGWTNELVSTSNIAGFGLQAPVPYDEFGQAQSTRGQFKRFTGELDGGYYYPILDAEIEFKGEYGNRFGFNIQSVDRKQPTHVSTESPVALYKLSVVENTNGYTPRIVQTVYGENSVVFALQPCVDQNGKSLYLPDVFEEAYSLSQGNNVLNFGEFSRIHVYDDYLSNVQDAMWEHLRTYYDQDLPAELVSSDWLGDQDALARARFGLINLVDGRYSDGVTPYRMVKIEKNRLIGSMNYAYAQQGQDGLEKLSNNRARFAQANAVLDTFVMDLKAEVESDFSYLHNQNRWDYSMVYDSGFATEAKDTLMAIGNCRQDVTVLLTPFSYGKFEWEDDGYVPHCVGATEEVLLQQLVYHLWDGHDGQIWVHYDVVINGVVYPWEDTQIGTYGTASEGLYRVEDYFYDHPHSLVEVVESNVMISDQWPTSWKAKTSADVRVELRPRYETAPNMEEYSNPDHFDNNPTFHIDENGVIYFCIKGLNEVPEDPEEPTESYLSQINLRTNLDDYSLSDGPPQLAGNYRVDIYFRQDESWDYEPAMIDIPGFTGWDGWYEATQYSEDIVEYDPDDASKRPRFRKYYFEGGEWVTRFETLTPTLVFNGVEIYAIPALQEVTGTTFTKTIRVILRNTNPEEVELKVEVKHEPEPDQWEALQTHLVYEAQSNWLLAAPDPDTIVSRLTLGANITDFGTTHRYVRDEPNQNVQWNLLEEQDPWPLNERSYYLRAEINGVEKLVFLNSEGAGYNRLDLLNQLFYSLLMNDDEYDRSRSFQFKYDWMEDLPYLSYVEIGVVQTPNTIGKQNSLQEENWQEHLYESNRPATLKILPYIDPDNGNGPRVVEDAYFWLFGNGESPVIQAPVKLIPDGL